VLQSGPVVSRVGLETHGLKNLGAVHWNLDAAGLYEHAIRRNEGKIAKGGAFVALTGEHTGRSPLDRFVVEEDSTKADIDWGDVNRPVSPEVFERLYQKVRAYFQGTELFVQDCFAGSDPRFRLPVRVINENAWHNLFARNMFIQPQKEELRDFAPEFTILHAPGLQADPEVDGTRSDVFVMVSFERKMVIIGGTWYAGEMKKSIFSVLNHILPAKGVLPMHCSANMGKDGDTAIFFGLSGTGKTTLSADASRTLIGDDEHGWGEDGVFNFEGGCYAKVIKLSKEAEPEIHATTERFGTVLENVVMNKQSRELDLDDARHTENTRSSYPIDFIPNASENGRGEHPKNIIMLTCDAFGVLPPIAKLSSAQAMYHFLSGYTAKVAGTEKGVKEPTAAFSACFGAPFMPRHPSVYAKLLGELMEKHGANCWLVNTGWSGGAYGVGSRMKIGYTRGLLNAALNGNLENAQFATDPYFGLAYPTTCGDIPAEVLNPRDSWKDKAAYDKAAANLTGLFEKNFTKFEEHVTNDVREASIRNSAEVKAAE